MLDAECIRLETRLFNKHDKKYYKYYLFCSLQLFWTFHNILHNMKALVILSHHDHHFSNLLVFMKKMNFCTLWALLVYFREKKLPTAHHFNIGAHIGICTHISRNTLLYLPSLKSDSPFCCSCWFQLDWQFQEHSIVMRNSY